MSNEKNNVEGVDKNTPLGNKVFVGNVPFQCTTEEFKECFENLEGFVTADIIRRHHSKLSRGFGFVVFDTEEQANGLLNETGINLRDRVFRFSSYLQDSVPKKKEAGSFQVYVNNLEVGTTSENLKEAFNDYDDLTTCVVNSTSRNTTGVVTFESYDSFKSVLNNPPTLGENTLQVKPFRKQNTKTENVKLNNPKVAYREGFKAGHIVGFQQGVQQGLSGNVNPEDIDDRVNHQPPNMNTC